MSEAFFDRLLDQIDPHQPQLAPDEQQARIVCGRWLVLRRLSLGLTLDTLSARAGLLSQHVLFLETGLADARLLPPQDVDALAAVLALDGEEARRVRAIIGMAVGAVARDADLLGAVVADLEAAGTRGPSS